MEQNENEKVLPRAAVIQDMSGFGKVSLMLLAAVVATYQVAGSLFEWAWTGSLDAALQDLRLGLPGMALQIAGGYLFIKYLLKK